MGLKCVYCNVVLVLSDVQAAPNFDLMSNKNGEPMSVCPHCSGIILLAKEGFFREPSNNEMWLLQQDELLWKEFDNYRLSIINKLKDKNSNLALIKELNKYRRLFSKANKE